MDPEITRTLSMVDRTVRVKVQRLHPDAKLPAYGRPGDAGLDLSAVEACILPAGERRLIPTGIALAIPPGTVGLIWDRSGLAGNAGLTTLSGVLDYQYRGEIKVVLLNTSQEPYEVKKGDRVAQLLIQPIMTAKLEEVEQLDDTHRGLGGFGSSGR